MEKIKHIAMICGAACFLLSLFLSIPMLYKVNKHRIKTREGRTIQFAFYAIFMIFFWPFVVLHHLGKEYIHNSLKK